MCPYSAFGVFKMDRVSNRLTSLSRRLTTTAGTDVSAGITASIRPSAS